METTIDLLTRAVASAKNESQLALALDLDRSALRKARERAHVSPELAAILAAYLHEDVARWTLVATMERSRTCPGRTKLARELSRGPGARKRQPKFRKQKSLG